MKAVKDSVIYLIGELFSKAMPFLLLPYLSRKLGPDGFGELSYYQTFLSLFVIFIGLSQEGAVARYFYFYGKRSLPLIVKTGYLYTLFVGGMITLFCIIVQSEILIYIAIAAIFQSFLSVQLSIRQCQKQAKAYVLIQFLLGAISAGTTVIFLEFFNTDLVQKRILAIVITNIVVFICAYILYKQQYITKKWQLQNYKCAFFYISAFGVPLIFHNVSFFLKGQLDRILIFNRFSESDLGIYAAGVQIASILSILLMALNKATVPYIFERLKNKTLVIQQINKWAVTSLFFVPIPALIAFLLPNDIYALLLGNKFLLSKHYTILFLLSNALSIPYFLWVNYLFFYGKNKLITLCSLISTSIYVLVLIYLVSYWTIDSIPYASIIGNISILPILFMISQKIEKRNESFS